VTAAVRCHRRATATTARAAARWHEISMDARSGSVAQWSAGFPARLQASCGVFNLSGCKNAKPVHNPVQKPATIIRGDGSYRKGSSKYAIQKGVFAVFSCCPRVLKLIGDVLCALRHRSRRGQSCEKFFWNLTLCGLDVAIPKWVDPA